VGGDEHAERSAAGQFKAMVAPEKVGSPTTAHLTAWISIPKALPAPGEPWILYPGLIWGLFVVLDAVKVFLDRPTTEDEIERQVRRVQRRDAS
jgi:hypothetical protein